jgi:hypothetical protein
LDAIYKKTDAATLKDNISKRKDTFRTPYSIEPVTHLRSCFIFGTANPTAILNDVTGSVRFWCVHLSQKVNFEALFENRDEIWSLATGLFKSGYVWRLTEEEDKQRVEVNKRFAVTEMLDDVMETYAYPESFNGQGRPFISLREAAETAFPDDSYPLDMSKQRRLDDSMNRIGYEKSQKSGRDSAGKVSKGYRLKESSAKEVVTTVTDGYSVVTGTVQGFEAFVTDVTSFSKPVENSSLVIPSSETSVENNDSQKFCENLVTVVTSENENVATPIQQSSQLVTEAVTKVKPNVTTVTNGEYHSGYSTENFKAGDWVMMGAKSFMPWDITPGMQLQIDKINGDFIHLVPPGKALTGKGRSGNIPPCRAWQIEPLGEI